MTELISAGKVSEYADGEMRVLRLSGGDIAVVQVEGMFYAFSNYCTHEGVNLANGYGDLMGKTIICLFHSSLFNIETGAVVGGPAYYPLTTYEVRIEGDEVMVARPDSLASAP